jgi:putative redox protein
MRHLIMMDLANSCSLTDLLATALGTCLLIIMGIAACRREWDLMDANVIVEKNQ